MSRHERRGLAREVAAFIASLPERLVEVPPSQWPSSDGFTVVPVEVWRSRHFVALVYDEDAPGCGERISIRRTSGSAGITWDELQSVKAAIGRGDRWAVEVFPPAQQVVNVANMRHLWVLNGPPAFAWGER